MMTHHNVRSLFVVPAVAIATLLSAMPAQAQAEAPPAETSPAMAPTTPAVVSTTPKTAIAPVAPVATESKKPGFRLGAHAELDVGVLFALRQGAAFAGGAVYGPFRAGMSYATFLSNESFGGTPKGFDLRANYIIGINASYFIGRSTDEGFYLQAMLHIKQQGVTNIENGAHKDLSSIAAGLELGFVWKIYKGFYVAPRIGALYYFKSPQGPDNKPVIIGGRSYDNDRHKVFDTYFIPTLSVGYSW